MFDQKTAVAFDSSARASRVTSSEQVRVIPRAATSSVRLCAVPTFSAAEALDFGDVAPTSSRVVPSAKYPPDGDPKNSLREVATQVDQSVFHTDDQALEALDVWRSVCAGEWELCEVFEIHGRKLMVARKLGANRRPVPLLTDREHQILGARARAYSVKVIAYELGLSQATVSRTLGIGLAKLRIDRPTELVRFWKACPSKTPRSPFDTSDACQARFDAFLPEGARAGFFDKGDRYVVLSYPAASTKLPRLPDSLSDVERLILDHLVSGQSPTEIADARGTSLRTIANQIQSLYKKVGVNSRIELCSYVEAAPSL